MRQRWATRWLIAVGLCGMLVCSGVQAAAAQAQTVPAIAAAAHASVCYLKRSKVEREAHQRGADEVLRSADKALYAAKRARQINGYYSQLADGLLDNVGPLVEAQPNDKPLSIALREMNEGLLSIEKLEA